MTALGKAIQTYRREHSLTVLDFSVRSGLSPTTVLWLEHGRTPSMATFRQAVKFFGWTDEEIGRVILETEWAPIGPKTIRRKAQEEAARRAGQELGGGVGE